MTNHQPTSNKTTPGKRAHSPLEERARSLTTTARDDAWDPAPVSMLEREIELALQHVRRTHRLHERLHYSLLYAECYIGSEILRLGKQLVLYSPQGNTVRNRLQQALLALEKERRRLAITKEEHIQRLQEKLLDLLNQHALLRL